VFISILQVTADAVKSRQPPTVRSSRIRRFDQSQHTERVLNCWFFTCWFSTSIRRVSFVRGMLRGSG